MREIEVAFGETLDDVIDMLLKAKEDGESVCCNFNGHKLCSDTVTPDSAYKEIFGLKKAEYYEYCKKQDEKYSEKLDEKFGKGRIR